MPLKKLVLLCTTSALLLPALVSAQSQLNYLLLGQSNMSGQGVVAELSEEQLKLPKNVTFILHGSEASINYIPKFGPEVSFAQTIAKKHPQESVRLIKFAPGGSLMKDWISKQSGKHYDTLIKQAKKSNNGRLPQVHGVLWMHGERDTKSKQLADDYENQLTSLVSMLKSDFKNPNLPVVIGRISIPKAFRPAVTEVRNAQQNVANRSPSISIISTDDLSTGSDKVHFDTNGQLLLGQRFAQAMR